jgi:DNA (cytosine-5)-methyltransferase 1
MKKIKTIEMFAGVGGFRIGLRRASENFEFIWANQWEPSKNKQISWQCYENNFGKESCINKNISEISVNEIPDFDFLTAGFPCQDYSVAKSLKYSGGIEGKKGVLWWDINRILEAKNPQYILLENVDRLLISPSKQRGRDFSIILGCLMKLGYFVEWKIINAAAYGMPQKRKRIFISATKEKHNILANTFEHKLIRYNQFDLSDDILKISNEFGKTNEQQYLDYGLASNFKIQTWKTKENYHGSFIYLGDILVEEETIDKNFYIQDLQKWLPLKNGRKIERVSKDGHSYIYSEGKMTFPDALNKPARTIVTGEGGTSPSRFKHVILRNGKYRRLTPIELERIQMFPDNHTSGFTDVQRAFMMGNALVTGVVEKIGKTIDKIHEEIF